MARDPFGKRHLDAPTTEAELTERAQSIAGLTAGELADRLDLRVPPDTRRAKGWMGQLIERALGGSAGSRPAPDFELIGVELKTIPVDARGRPLESTFVCSIDLMGVGETGWAGSRVRKKLNRVLWVPVEGETQLLLATRRIGTPLLWSPSAEEEASLEADWRTMAAFIHAGRLDEISADAGEVMQVRPKAATGRDRRWTPASGGGRERTLPRAFYLRPHFTARILERHYVIGV